jgi:hypothetical protein
LEIFFVLFEVGLKQIEFAFEDDAFCAVESDPIAFAEDATVGGDSLLLNVYVESGATDDAAFAPAASDESGVAGHAAFGGEDSLRCVHAVDIFGRSFVSNENDLFALLRPGFGVVGGENNLTKSATGTCGKSFGEGLDAQFGCGVNHGVEEFVELSGFDAHDGFFFGDESLAAHIHRHADGGGSISLAGARLKHPEATFLDGKLDVLHVAIVVFEFVSYGNKLAVCVGHSLFEAYEMLGIVGLVGDVEGIGGANACDNVFALSVWEPFAVKGIFAGCGIARESDAGCGVFAHVAEDHCLDVDGSAPRRRDVFDFAIGDGAFAHPGGEDGANSAPELCSGVLWELFAEHFADFRFVDFDKNAEVAGSEFGVEFVAFLMFDAVEFSFELLANAFAFRGFDAGGFFHDDV